MVYMRRTADLELDDLFPFVAVIALDGPKAVGKTTTAAQRACEQRGSGPDGGACAA